MAAIASFMHIEDALSSPSFQISVRNLLRAENVARLDCLVSFGHYYKGKCVLVSSGNIIHMSKF